MWLIAAVQSIAPLRAVAASTARTIFLVSVVVGKDRQSMPTGHGKQTIAAARVPPDWKGTNRTSIAVAGISPPAWRSAPSKAAFFKALAEVPTNVFTRSDCFKARKNNSDCVFQSAGWSLSRASALNNFLFSSSSAHDQQRSHLSEANGQNLWDR
jgi:hypothetical protein